MSVDVSFVVSDVMEVILFSDFSCHRTVCLTITIIPLHSKEHNIWSEYSLGTNLDIIINILILVLFLF